MKERQYANPLEAIPQVMSDAGTPGADKVVEEARALMDRLVAAGDDAYERLQANQPDEFLRQGRQLGGQ